MKSQCLGSASHPKTKRRLVYTACSGEGTCLRFIHDGVDQGVGVSQERYSVKHSPCETIVRILNLASSRKKYLKFCVASEGEARTSDVKSLVLTSWVK